jgi:hypothetical protein
VLQAVNRDPISGDEEESEADESDEDYEDEQDEQGGYGAIPLDSDSLEDLNKKREGPRLMGS